MLRRLWLSIHRAICRLARVGKAKPPSGERLLCSRFQNKWTYKSMTNSGSLSFLERERCQKESSKDLYPSRVHKLLLLMESSGFRNAVGNSQNMDGLEWGGGDTESQWCYILPQLTLLSLSLTATTMLFPLPPHYSCYSWPQMQLPAW